MTISHLYQPFYCEENIWQLAQSKDIDAQERVVAFVSNPTKSCAFWYQRAAPSPQMPTVWDYHVILFGKLEERWHVWDLDTLLDFPSSASEYFRHTFSGAEEWPDRYLPVFRLINADEYIKHFSSDRTHMLDTEGEYMKQPPSWEAPYQTEEGMNLGLFSDITMSFFGEVLSLQKTKKRFAEKF